MREAVEDKRQRVLLISPAGLPDGMGDRFMHKYQLFVETISYEQLTNDIQLCGEESYIRFKPNKYGMVIIDESQAFRNPDTISTI